MPIWDLKLIVNRFVEDDFDDPKKNQQADHNDSEDELDEDEQSLVDLVKSEVIPLADLEIVSRKFKKRGLRHLVELEQQRFASQDD